MFENKSYRWWSIALRGVVAVLFGVLSLIAPAAAVVSLVLLFGAFALVDGVLALSAARAADGRSRRAMIARGIASIVAGLVALVWPGISTLALLMVIGLWSIAAGALEILTAYRVRAAIQGEWLIALEGGLSVLFGIALLVSPLAGAIVLGIWVGAYAIVVGTMLLLAAFEARSFANQQGMGA
jgi:uncharacterized membrane protein HdeD (DUF308 family)